MENWNKNIENEIKDFWKKNYIYEKWLLLNYGKDLFVFLEGPPYTTGSPHMGHAWNRVLKDVVLRYKAKRGYFVWKQAGFDMHGLPIEEKVEKKLNIKNKKEIEKIGVDKFIKECFNFAYGSMREWLKFYWELAHWLDSNNSYLPITNEFIEKVWKMIKRGYESGLIYRDKKPVWWCPRCQTTLSKKEVELGYEDPKYTKARDLSIYVKLKGKDNVYYVIWTTTPWTLTFNLGIMVNPNIKYALLKVREVYVKEFIYENNEIKKVELEKGNNYEYWIIAKDAIERLLPKLNVEYEIVKEFYGKELELKEYEPIFKEELKDILDEIKSENSFKIWLSEEYVNTLEGTGLVHSAPGCGFEDFEVAKKYNVKPFNTADDEGYIRNIKAFEGWRAKFDDIKWIEKLLEKKALVYVEVYEHDYPICWRCGTRAIIRLSDQWFINVEKIKSSLLKDLEDVYFASESAKEAFRMSIQTAPDWVISRQRYFGIPLPIWKCENGHIKVIDDVKELKKDAKEIIIVKKITNYAKDLIKIYFRNNKIIEVKRIDNFDKLFNELEDKSVIIVEEFTEEDYNKLFEKYYVVRSYGFIDYEVFRVYNYNLHLPDVDKYEVICECGKKMKRVPDVLDVWVDSGSTAFSTDVPKEVDFIVEGIDQIRGWFYSLAVIGKIYFGKIPYKAVYDHGYALDAKGRKMSKSLGNVITPQEVIDKFGVDSLRFYLSSASKAHEDLLFDMNEVKNKFNSLNILWNIHNYLIEYSKYYNINPRNIKIELDPIDRYMLSVLERTKKILIEKMDKYYVYEAGRLLENLYLELSRFYIKVNRERIKEEPEKVLYVIYKVLLDTINMLSIIAPHITEAIYQNLKKEFGLEWESIHLMPWPEVNENLIDENLERKVNYLKELFEAGLNLRNKLKINIRKPLLKLYINTNNKEVIETIKLFEEFIKDYLNVKHLEIANISGEKFDNFEIIYDTTFNEDLEKEWLLREIRRSLQDLRKRYGLRKGENANIYIKCSDKIRDLIIKNKEYLEKETDSKIILTEKIEISEKIYEYRVGDEKIIVSLFK